MRFPNSMRVVPQYVINRIKLTVSVNSVAIRIYISTYLTILYNHLFTYLFYILIFFMSVLSLNLMCGQPSLKCASFIFINVWNEANLSKCLLQLCTDLSAIKLISYKVTYSPFRKHLLSFRITISGVLIRCTSAYKLPLPQVQAGWTTNSTVTKIKKFSKTAHHNNSTCGHSFLFRLKAYKFSLILSHYVLTPNLPITRITDVALTSKLLQTLNFCQGG